MGHGGRLICMYMWVLRLGLARRRAHVGSRFSRRPGLCSTDGRDTANTAWAESSSEDESWAVIVEVNNATSGESELYDSGASRHMSPFQHRFTNLRSIPPRPITAANNRVFYATGLGDLKIDVPNGSSSTCITLKDALYAPDMSLTVVSISKIADAGYTVLLRARVARSRTKQGRQ